MSYGSHQEKRQEVSRICRFTATRRNFTEWIQRQKPNDPQIILGVWVMPQTGIQHSDDIMGYPNTVHCCFVNPDWSVVSDSVSAPPTVHRIFLKRVNLTHVIVRRQRYVNSDNFARVKIEIKHTALDFFFVISIDSC